MDDLTGLLKLIGAGETDALKQLLPLVYDELQRLARAKMAHERPGQTIQATALVHEAYLRLLGSAPGCAWDGRGQFFTAAAEAMQRILIEEARRKKRLKRGGELCRVELSEGLVGVLPTNDDILALGEALEDLEKVDAVCASVARLRYIVGLTHEEVGRSLGISERDSQRRWGYARAWLRRHMEQGEAIAREA